jgi:hypothetical protein
MNLKNYLNYIEKNTENQPCLVREKNMTGWQKKYQMFISRVQKEDG